MKNKIDQGRKSFIKKIGLLGMAPFVNLDLVKASENPLTNSAANENKMPMVISTWRHGMDANRAAMQLLDDGKNSLDAVEAGVRISESDPEVSSVGYGGLPDREGNVTLDACIMDHMGNCGSVSYLQNIMNPISVARKVMEETPHIMLSGEGALQFALDQGFKEENLLSKKAEERWKQWKQDQKIKKDAENHDTIGMLALDEDGTISGACTTSGLAWKLPGRVGDSPIIGAGLFVDGKVGAATATGKGEAVIKIAGTHLIVELMRMGKSPQEACEIAIERIIDKQKDHKSFQVGFLALNMNGEHGAYSLQEGFQYAYTNRAKHELINSAHAL